MGHSKWKGGFDGSEEVDCFSRIFSVIDGQMHEARAAIDHNVEEAFARLAVLGLWLRQVSDVDMDVAKVVISESAVTPCRADICFWRPAVEIGVFQDALDAVAVR